MNWQEVNGKSGICHVKIRNYDKKDGGVGQANQIEKWYPSYDQPQITQNAPQQPSASYPQNSTQPWQPPQNGSQSGWNKGQF